MHRVKQKLHIAIETFTPAQMFWIKPILYFLIHCIFHLYVESQGTAIRLIHLFHLSINYIL